MTEPEIDYKKLFEALSRQVEKQLSQENEYFELLAKVQELNPYQTLVADNMLKMKLSDQLKMIKVIVKCGEISKALCEKYNFEDIAEEQVEED